MAAMDLIINMIIIVMRSGRRTPAAASVITIIIVFFSSSPNFGKERKKERTKNAWTHDHSLVSVNLVSDTRG